MAPVVRTVFAIGCLAGAFVAGCGGAPDVPFRSASAPPAADPESLAANASETVLPQDQAADGGQPAAAAAATLKRQIIYDADVRIIVEEFEGIPEKVDQLVASSGGFVARQRLHGRSGSPR